VLHLKIRYVIAVANFGVTYFQFNSSAVELLVSYTAGDSLTDAAMCMNLVVFVKHSDIVCYFLITEILYCAKATALHMPDWKISEGG